MKLLKVGIAFIALVSLQIAAAQWLHVPPPVEAKNLMIFTAGMPVAVGYTEEFYWTCEGANATARGTGLTAHRVTSVEGTFSTISDCSSVQAKTGTYSLLIGDDDEKITFPITSGNIFSTTGSASMWVYVADDPVGNSSPLYVAMGDGSVRLLITTTRTASLYVSDSAFDSVEIATAALTADTWHRVSFRWDFATDNWGIRLDEGAWVTSTTALVGFGTLPTEITFGDPGFGPLGGNIYIDDIQIWNTYDGT